jgi:hypothetical protein
MNVLNERPPVYDRAAEVFPLKGDEIFAYGDTIYNPSGGYLPEWTIAHEKVHQTQQGLDPAAWWDRYLVDEEFRLDQELEAHRVEYLTYCKITKDRELRAKALRAMAKRLSGPMYGKLMTYVQAQKRIRTGT